MAAMVRGEDDDENEESQNPNSECEEVSPGQG